MSKEDAEKWDSMLTAPISGEYDNDDDFTTGASVITTEDSVF